MRRASLRSTRSASLISVLVVDDQPDVRLAFAYMLDALGCKVGEARDGHHAIRYLAAHRVDIVLADIYMPGMDGVTLVDAIHKRPPPRPKIIAISGSENLGYKASLQAASVVGADATLVKPVSKEKLLETIRALMRDEKEDKRSKPRGR